MSVRRRIAAALAKGVRETARDAGIGAYTGTAVSAASGDDPETIARRALTGAAVGAGGGRVIRSVVKRTGNAEAVSSVRRGRGLLPRGDKAKERVGAALDRKARRSERNDPDRASDLRQAAGRARGARTPSDADLDAQLKDTEADLRAFNKESPRDYHEMLGLDNVRRNRREEIAEIKRQQRRRRERRTANAEAVSALRRREQFKDF